MSSSSHTQTQSQQSNTIDPKEMQMYQNNYATAQQNAANLAQPYTGQLTAGFTPAQVQAQGLFSGIAADPTYTNNANSASSAAAGLVGQDPLSASNLQQYLNPYTQDVANTTMAQLNQSRGMAQTADAQSASAAHAFDGSRAGVQGALTNQYYDQDAAQALANLNYQGYTNAQQAALASRNSQLNTAAQAANLNNNALATATNQAGILGAVGDQQQQQQQTELNNAYQAWLTGKNLTVEQQNLLNAALGMIPIQQTVNGSSDSTTTSSGGLGGIFGGLGSLAKGAAGIIPLL